MPVCKLYQTINQLSSGQRLLGLDIGKKTIGLAISDPDARVAAPLRILWRRKFTPDARELIAIIAEHDIGGLVLGWPLNMDGSQGPSCDSLRDFAHAFLRLHDIAISFQDERLSTKGCRAGNDSSGSDPPETPPSPRCAGRNMDIAICPGQSG